MSLVNVKWENLTFTEKIKWRAHHPLLFSWMYADKIQAKTIARHRAPECRVAEILFTISRASSLDELSLPPSYVLKASHGSGWFVLVKDGVDQRTGQVVTNAYLRQRVDGWLKKMYRAGSERQYVLIPRRAFIEDYAEIRHELRFFCFNGRVRFVMHEEDAPYHNRTVFYDRHWKALPVRWKYPLGDAIPRPDCWKEHCATVERLASGIDFVRIDVFLSGPQLYFGEFTFTPSQGLTYNLPEEVNRLWGSYWTQDMSRTLQLTPTSRVQPCTRSARIRSMAKLYSRIALFRLSPNYWMRRLKKTSK